MMKNKNIHLLKRPFLFVIFALLAGCDHDHSHDDHEGGHDHGGHEHHENAEEGLSALSVTIWTEKTELFMEYEPLVIGKPSRFAAHLTTMDDFKAVTTGVLELSLRSTDGTLQEAKADGPSSPGIFRFEIVPQKAGPYKMSLSYDSSGLTTSNTGKHFAVGSSSLSDEIPAGDAVVHANVEEAQKAAPPEEGGGIGYTKEQQWKTDFATAAVSEHELQPSVNAVGEVEPISGREAKITAPTRGRLTLATPVPLPGIKVEKGQLLATVSPYLNADGDRSTLAAAQRSAKAEYTASLSQLERLERLVKEQAVPEKRVEEARAHVSVAKANLEAANGRLRQYSQGASGLGGKGAGAFKLRSPISGTLVEIDATTGDSVEEGKQLFVVIDISRVWLTARAFEPDIPKVDAATTAWFKIEGYREPFFIDESNGRLVTVGHVIDPNSRTVPVVFEVDNPSEKIRIGQFAEVFIATGELSPRLAVPADALLNDGFKRIVFVQAEGETFERRVVETGIRSDGMIEVVSGLRPGERVVTKGAYEVRLAAASGSIPEHGHVH